MVMAGNKSLRAATRAKQDEFYTQLQDIANELRHYAPHFKGKTVLCNCDDPYESNFFKYFALKFNELGLKKLICTCYNGSPITATQLDLFEERLPKGEKSKVAYKLVLTEVKDWNEDGAVDIEDVRVFLEAHKPERLRGTGDFASEECIELLKEADIVVTNPPFSLFREYLAQLVKYNKKYLIIGNQNAIAWKEIFPLIKENKLWLGFKSGDMSFTVPEYYEEKAVRFWIDENGQKWRSMGNICWFTNLDHNKRHDPIDLYKHYTPEEYPKYDNYDAINVDKTADIPADYDGVMGVPLTFLDKYCPEQFCLLGIMNTGEENKGIRYPNTPHGRPIVNGKEIYIRILIRKIK